MENQNDYRLSIYNQIVKGCKHLYSKSKLQVDVFQDLMSVLYPASQGDVLFLVKLAAYMADRNKNQDKDLRLLSIYANALSVCDGQPVRPGSQVRKPNYRKVSGLLLDALDPKYFYRLASLQTVKWRTEPELPEASHFPGSLRRAMQRYLETMPLWMLKRHVEAGYKHWLRGAYRLLHTSPDKHFNPKEVYSLLNWKPKGERDWQIEKEVLSFAGLTDDQIAEKITSEKIPFHKAISALDREPSPIILAVFLENSLVKPNQALINQKLFYDSGLLEDEKYFNVFQDLVSQATVIDRVAELTKNMESEDKEFFRKLKAEKRREQFKEADIGRICLAIDVSLSMEYAIDLAKRTAAVIAEIVGNSENFIWGVFNTRWQELTIFPKTEDHAVAALTGISVSGMTDLSEPLVVVQRSEKPADVFIYITDGQQTVGFKDISDLHKPVVVNVKVSWHDTRWLEWLDRNGIDHVEVDAEVFQQKALIVETLKRAVRGKYAIIDEIMSYDMTRFGLDI